MTMAAQDAQKPGAPEQPFAAPTGRRPQVIVGTALAGLAGSTLIGAMMAIYALKREEVVSQGGRFPVKYVISEVPTNVMLITVWSLFFFAVWAAYSARRSDRPHAGLALTLSALFGFAFINAQVFVWSDMGVKIADTAYGTLFYTITGTMVALAVLGLVYSLVTLFYTVAGRMGRGELQVAHALYWLFVSIAYSAVWFLVYVVK